MNSLLFIADSIEAFGAPARSWDGPVAIALKLLAVSLLETLFPNRRTRRDRMGIAGDFRARTGSSHVQFQSARSVRD